MVNVSCTLYGIVCIKSFNVPSIALGLWEMQGCVGIIPCPGDAYSREVDSGEQGLGYVKELFIWSPDESKIRKAGRTAGRGVDTAPCVAMNFTTKLCPKVYGL